MKESTFEYAEDIVSKAMMFAISAHSGQYRKGSRTPAILHAMEAATIIATLTTDEELMAAALLHDTVEDTDVVPEQIEAMFGPHVAFLVASETENKRENIDARESWQVRKEESLKELRDLDNIEVKMLWLSDKLSNMRSFYLLHEHNGDEMWNKFNQKNPKIQEWYYREIADLLSDLKDTVAYKEYIELVDKTFGKEK